ncbi:MAG: hypothetical protein ABI700_11010 [Chloroflexota bacterium]
MRRSLIGIALVIPALVLIGWLVAAQLPRWTAPQPGWFDPYTPALCVVVDSLKRYGATRADVGGIGRDAAVLDAAQVVAKYYDFGTTRPPINRSIPLGVEATLPGDQQRAYYAISMALSADPLRKVAVIYLDAETGEARALISTIEYPAANCDFDVKAALLVAIKSPPLILLVAYGALTVLGLGTWWLFKRRGNHR